MSGAHLPPATNPPKAAADALTAAAALGLQAQAGQQQKLTVQRLRDAAHAAAVTRASSTSSSTNTSSSSRGSSASLNQAYSQVWSAVTRNVRQVAVKNTDANAAESADADDGVDESPECSDDNATDENTELSHTHGKHAKHGLERRGPNERNLVKQNAAQPKPKQQDQQHKQKRKRRENESVDLDADDDVPRIDPWASASFEGEDGASAPGQILGHSIDFEGLEPVQRLAAFKKIESLTDASTVLRETGLPLQEHSKELIWALGILAILLLILGVIFGLTRHSDNTTEPTKATPKAAQQQEQAAQPVNQQTP
jgi:hypothetical protein